MIRVALALLSAVAVAACQESQPSSITPSLPETDSVQSDVEFWLTNPDKSALFQRMKTGLIFAVSNSTRPTIAVDTSLRYQSMDGFGYTLTDGSAALIHALPDDQRSALLANLFSTNDQGIGISYLRISIGASDLSATTYTYDDRPPGQKDEDMSHFSLDAARTDLIPVLKEILGINPDLKILGSPWSAPVWMKDNGGFKGGSLRTQYYAVYAQYFVRYIQGMAAEGIPVDAITPQNEPLNPDNTPSMKMLSSEEATFIGADLGPAFDSAGITTKIIVYDHNADVPEYATQILSDPGAARYVDGSAFHLYGGSITALSGVHFSYPDKNLYFTEQYTNATGDFGGDLDWHTRNLIIGAPNNWSRNVLEWNLAADANLGPHTNGGCTVCLGALTIAGSVVTRNVSYYIIAHAARFVRPGSVRIDSTNPGALPNVAYQRPDGKKVLIVLNDSNGVQEFNIQFNGKVVTVTLAGGAVGTFVW